MPIMQPEQPDMPIMQPEQPDMPIMADGNHGVLLNRKEVSCHSDIGLLYLISDKSEWGAVVVVIVW